eukprot:CAMPEP_0171630378 /NCGR_PEP_ID=MMETSP0990-20121206/22877_1 /TAXON_ID=483369 /ORGANISM="non described non described, Strain CCMP2098" /LENGTH=144 /DNA_ID=CAMNT_0012199503 /DNA_START=359 /DNA_END=793 /DNA_ORIENTATION=-
MSRDWKSTKRPPIGAMSTALLGCGVTATDEAGVASAGSKGGGRWGRFGVLSIMEAGVVSASESSSSYVDCEGKNDDPSESDKSAPGKSLSCPPPPPLPLAPSAVLRALLLISASFVYSPPPMSVSFSSSSTVSSMPSRHLGGFT